MLFWFSKLAGRLPVSSLACKELRSLHFIPAARKKPNKLEKLTALLRSVRDVTSRAKLPPPNQRDRQVNKRASQLSRTSASVGTSARGRKA